VSGRASAGSASFGTLLRRYRGSRGLTQEQLAEAAGLHAQEISKLERGVVRNPRSATVELLADALNLDAQHREAFAAAARAEQATLPTDVTDAESLLAIPADSVPPPGVLPGGSRMPLALNPLFVGRGEELLRVAGALRGGDATVALGQVVATTGLGGLGKTQLAVELVHRLARFFAGGVFWLSFASPEDIPLQVAACAGSGAVGLEADLTSRPLEERVKLVMGAWQSAVPRLLVFDNCEEESLLETWRPTSGGCRVLVTSRRSRWSPTLGVTALPLGLPPRPDSIELLRRYLPDLAAADLRLDAIADRLGDLPLALHLAGRYLLAYRAEVSLDDYLAELEQPALVQHASLLGEGLDDSPSPTRHVQSLAQTFALCRGRLDQRHEVDRVAIALLARTACLAPGEPVPRELLARTLEEVEPRRRADGLRRLSDVGLVEEGEGWIRLHRLIVHFVRHESLDPAAQPAVDRALTRCGRDAVEDHLTGTALAAVIPHLVAVAAGGDTGDGGRAADLCFAAGLALRSAGDFRAATLWYERTVALREKVLGSDHPETARAMNELGTMLWARGDLRAARPLLERALAIRERALGPDHSDTTADLNNLALLYRDQGESAAARRLFERALDIRERVLGSDHPLTARSLYNLALVHLDQGELVTAGPLFERALDIRERVAGPDHPHTAYSLNGLALLRQTRGELDAARRLFERALDIRERVLGPDHHNTAVSLHNLALLYRGQGEPAAARRLLERALDIRERVLGPHHPSTIATRCALAEITPDNGSGGQLLVNRRDRTRAGASAPRRAASGSA